MKARLLLVIGLVVGIVGLTAVAVRADGIADFLRPGGSVLLLPPAQLTDPPPEGARKEPLLDNTLPIFLATCPGGSSAPTPSVGFVILNSHPPLNAVGQDSMVSAEVVVQGGIPNATYTIHVIQDPGNCPNVLSVGTVTTNGQGNGTGHAEVSRIPGAMTFWVIVIDEPDFLFLTPKSLLASPAATLD